MRLHIIKYLSLGGFLASILFLTAPTLHAQMAIRSAPNVSGSVQAEGTLAGVDNIWVRWTDRNNNIRYAKTALGGNYTFSSWQNMSQAERDNDYNTCIKPNDPSADRQPCSNALLTSGYTRLSGIWSQDGFGCNEDPHVFTAVRPVGWGGSFSSVTASVSNTQTSLTLSPIIYSHPTSAFPTASIFGPTLARPGDNVGYYSQASAPDAPINYVQMWYRPRPSTTWIALGGTCSSTTTSARCPSSGTSNFTTDLGTYDVVVNAHNIFDKWCSGNLAGLLPGWVDCGSNSRIVLYSYTAPTGRISVSSSGSSLNCSPPQYCWGAVTDEYSFTAVGNDANNKLNQVEIWAAKTDNTDWSGACPAGISASNPKWCLLKSRTETNDQTTFSLNSGNWKAPAVGNYYIIIKAYNSYPGNNACSGNPMETLSAGWARCSSSDNDFVQLDLNNTAPRISSLQVSNSSSSQLGTFAGSNNRVSGLQGSEGGSNWLNPMNITLNAVVGSSPIKQYFVAFYDKKEGTSTVQSAYSSIISNPATSEPNANLKSLLIAHPDAGFLLAYDASSSKSYVWDPTSTNPNKWVNITGVDWSVCGLTADKKDCDNKLYYDVFPGNTLGIPSNPNKPHSWDVRFYRNFGSKNMYTAGYVTDSNNLSIYQADINP